METCPSAKNGQLSTTEAANELVQGLEPLPLDTLNLFKMCDLKGFKFNPFQ